MEKAISQIYQKKEKLVIIGLTGRTGAGCSTVASILTKKSFEDLDIKPVKQCDFKNTDERKFRIIYEYMSFHDHWQSFSVIEISSIILASVLELGVPAFQEYINNITDLSQADAISIGEKDKVNTIIEQMDYMFGKVQPYTLASIDPSKLSIEQIDAYYTFYLTTIKEYKHRFRNAIESFSCYETHNDKLYGKQQSKYHLYTYLLQQFGNNIRCSGSPYDNVFSQDHINNFIERINTLIKIIIRYDELHDRPYTRICIDAIRNPYEALYLRDNYRGFYLMAINTDDSDRCARLRNLTAEELDNLDKIEYAQKMKNPEDVFYHQNIEGCIENAGIHIYNPNITNEKYYLLTEQLIKYVALMLHPGLITPSAIERCMQLAYNAKFNSGCLSRQVGAVVTREDFSIQSVGWNDVPKGQVPCILRDTNLYCSSKDCESFSAYEIENRAFSNAIRKVSNAYNTERYGRFMSYCFKDVYNSITGEKNQVFTRALHAEENAFLQISKYGGTSVSGGNLFSTASPCELCAKKAYQLGIRHIYYINPYPGISQKHILSFGKTGNPSMHLFYGAIGQTYLDFYEPRIATKDELELLSDINIKKLISVKKDSRQLGFNDLYNHKVEVTLTFTHDRNEIECSRSVSVEILTDKFEELEKRIFWTGSSYDGTSLVQEKSDPDITFSENKTELPYTYSLKASRSKNSLLNYEVKTIAKDEKHIMEPYLAHMVKYKTDVLTLRVCCPASSNLLNNVRTCLYADFEMKQKICEAELKCNDKGDEYKIYEFTISNANVNYTYSIEWDFEKKSVNT